MSPRAESSARHARLELAVAIGNVERRIEELGFELSDARAELAKLQARYRDISKQIHDVT